MREWLRGPLSFGVWLATCLVIGLLFAGGVILYSTVGSNRIAAIEDLCEHDNANANHNIEFIRFDVNGSPELVAKARARFTKTPNCHKFAVETVARGAKR